MVLSVCALFWSARFSAIQTSMHAGIDQALFWYEANSYCYTVHSTSIRTTLSKHHSTIILITPACSLEAEWEHIFISYECS